MTKEMTMAEKMIAAAKANAAKLADQSEETSGGFEYVPPAKGNCLARFVTYVEVGDHPQSYLGEAKAPCREAIIQFELLGKKHAKEIEFKDKDGKTQTKTIYPIVTERIPIKLSAKATFFKLFNAMKAGREGITNMLFMLGEGFMINVEHNEVEKEVNGKKVKITYANIRGSNGWNVSAPIGVDDDGEPKPYKVPKATVEERLLLWDAPAIEQWNSIHIAGERTVGEGEKERTISNNWMQNECKKALDWDGSGMQVIVQTVEGDLPDMSGETGGTDDGDVLEDEDDLGGHDGEETKKAPADEPEDESGDPFADLGLEDEPE
jgi:hypothetical protein